MKLAIITGGSKGLGKALVKQFEAGDYTVVEFSRSGAGRTGIPCDFKDYENAARIVSQQLSTLAQQQYTEVVLVNNVATISPIGPISDYSPEEYADNITINFLSTIMVSGLFTKFFQAQPCSKRIIFISSGAAVKARAGWSLYCSTKAGLEQFFRAYIMEQSMQEHPIKAVICNPGVIDTGMQEIIRNTSEEAFPEKPRFVGLKKNKQLQSPDAVAEKIYTKCLTTTEDYVMIQEP